MAGRGTLDTIRGAAMISGTVKEEWAGKFSRDQSHDGCKYCRSGETDTDQDR
jgi:hypothetical protein